MKVEMIDGHGMLHCITSRNPELLADWLTETFDTIRPNVEYPVTITVWPTIGPPDSAGTPLAVYHRIKAHAERLAAERPPTAPWPPSTSVADWVCDSRVLGRYELVTDLGGVLAFMLGQVEEAEELAARTEAGPCYGAECDHVSHRPRRP